MSSNVAEKSKSTMDARFDQSSWSRLAPDCKSTHESGQRPFTNTNLLVSINTCVRANNLCSARRHIALITIPYAIIAPTKRINATTINLNLTTLYLTTTTTKLLLRFHLCVFPRIRGWKRHRLSVLLEESRRPVAEGVEDAGALAVVTHDVLEFGE